MTTVTTSNIERSPTFVSKHATAKNQATTPIANVFASLLMASEGDGSDSSTDALDPLTTDGATPPRTQGPESTVALADPGQAALAGLLNWQALATAGNTAQAANVSTELASNSATSDLNTRQFGQDSFVKLNAGITASATNLSANDATELPLTQKGLPLMPKLAVDSLPLATPSTLASPAPTPVLTTAALQPTPSFAAPALETSTLYNGMTPLPPGFQQAGNSSHDGTESTKPITNLATNDAAGLAMTQKGLSLTGKLAVDSLPLTTTNALASPALTPALATAALQPTPNVPAPTLPAPALEPSTLRSGATLEATQQPPTLQRQAAEALSAGIEKPTTSKSRYGVLRNQLPTSTAGTAGGKSGVSNAKQNNLSPTTAVELSMSPRATVDLAVRTATEAEPSTIEGDSPKAESTSLRAEGAHPGADSTPHSTDHVQPNEQPAGPLAPAEPTSMTGQAVENMADIMDELSGQIAYWASQGTQRANLTVGGDKDNPLEVSIAMRDGEVHVAFEAAQDDIREALTTNAEALLRNMLESKGMTLGDVTVGQRPPSPDQGATTPQERNGQNPEAAARMAPTASAGATQTGQGISAPMLRRPDIATAQKVDLFA